MHFLLHAIRGAFLLSQTAISAPPERFRLHSRNETLSSPTITTIVRSSNGTDVSSSFRTLVYYQSDRVLRTSNLTDRQVLSVRRIDSCRAAGAHFLGSLCVHSQGPEVSLWRYTVHCEIAPIPMYDLFNPFNPNGGPPAEPRLFAEHGSCAEHEICVNSMPHEVHGVPVATCVDMKNFLPTPRDSEDIRQGTQGQGSSTVQQIGSALQQIGAKKAGIAFSRPDASSVIELDALEVDVGMQGHDREVGQKQQAACKDCYGMRTKIAPADADFMKIEATLMATAAMAGVIWVTIFAG